MTVAASGPALESTVCAATGRLATLVAVGAALYLVEYAPTWVRAPLSFLVEMLAAIPSIIYGLWGFFVLAPLFEAPKTIQGRRFKRLLGAPWRHMDLAVRFQQLKLIAQQTREADPVMLNNFEAAAFCRTARCKARDDSPPITFDR